MQQAPGWDEIHRKSLAAVEARLAAFVRAAGQGTPIASDAVRMPTLGKRFDAHSSQQRRWYDQQFYIVDAARGAGAPDDRHLVTLVRFDPRQHKLSFELPEQSRAALGGARSVRVFALDGMRVRLAEDLRRALRRAGRGKLVEALWRETRPLPKARRPRKGVELDGSQREALGALTRKGAAFVWGPPGTGKTKVIIEAVRDALENDRSVLIASHTHVAVDNVLEGLLDLDLELEPGDVVRVASPLTEEKVSGRVLDHEFLLLRKAVDMLAEEAAEQDAREASVDVLDEARVVACTLASLCSRRLDRRFDVVILDEAASIEPPYVAVAGSRADRTFGVVGDFLQNAPIAEAADEEDRTAEDPWLSSDVFSLAGIRDRATAEAHPRCVALRRQYRFPSIVAALVNGFCYDGLLESARPSAAADGATVTLIDTSPLEERRLVPAFPRSWTSPLGLQLFAIIGGHHAARGAHVGYVTPYRAQAEHAQQLSDRHGLGIPCGTAHRFQGRQFDIVLVDLMQDDRARWAGAADLHGDARQASAAKLLNVALTRMRRRLYLFADWDFVRGHDTPGMRALAALEEHPNFRLVDARDVLAWASRGPGTMGTDGTREPLPPA